MQKLCFLNAVGLECMNDVDHLHMPAVGLMILMGSFQLKMFYDSMLSSAPIQTSFICFVLLGWDQPISW